MGAADPPAERHPPCHATTAPSPSPTATPTPNCTPPRRPRICSTSSHSTAIAPARTNPIRGRCPSPTPSAASSTHAVEALSAMLTGTRLEDDLADLLWSFVNLFHRKVDRIERELDSNEQAQRRGQAEQDGSEVKSVELERLIDQGLSLIERRNAFEFFRDHAAELFEVATGSAWRPRAGSMVNHRVADRRDDRQPRISRRPPPRRHRSARPCRHPHRLHRRHRLQRSHPHLGRARQDPRQASRHGAAARRQPARRRAHRRLLGRQSQSSTGRLQARLDPRTATPRPSSATTGCSKRCRSASSSSPAPASPPTSPTRRRSSASRPGASTSLLRRRPSRGRRRLGAVTSLLKPTAPRLSIQARSVEVG